VELVLAGFEPGPGLGSVLLPSAVPPFGRLPVPGELGPGGSGRVEQGAPRADAVVLEEGEDVGGVGEEVSLLKKKKDFFF